MFPRMRTIAYNVYACAGWSPSGPPPSSARELPWQMAEALAPFRPDILTLSEAPGEAIVEEIGDRLGLEFVYFPSGQKWPGALLTRFPLLSVLTGTEFSPDATLFTRHAGRAVLRLPEGELSVYSAHLHVKEAAIRRREIELLLGRIAEDRAAGRAILLQGDLNHQPRWPEYGIWQAAGLTDTWQSKGVGKGETIKAHQPDRRIDYIFACAAMARRLSSVRVLTSPPFGTGSTGAPPAFFLSDHLPVMAEFAEAP